MTLAISRETLPVAFALPGPSFDLLMAAMRRGFFGERRVPARWPGLPLIAAGVLRVTHPQAGIQGA